MSGQITIPRTPHVWWNPAEFNGFDVCPIWFLVDFWAQQNGFWNLAWEGIAQPNSEGWFVQNSDAGHAVGPSPNIAVDEGGYWVAAVRVLPTWTRDSETGQKYQVTYSNAYGESGEVSYPQSAAYEGIANVTLGAVPPAGFVFTGMA